MVTIFSDSFGDPYLLLLNIRTGARGEVVGCGDWVTEIAYSPTGDWLALGGDDGVALYDGRTFSFVRSFCSWESA